LSSCEKGIPGGSGTPDIALCHDHGDPADRIIVATARGYGFPFFIAEKNILAWAKKSRLIEILYPGRLRDLTQKILPGSLL
jgi:hypothetical protein